MSAHYDLHAHSTASDGTLSPADLVHRAHQQGVTHLALTDHDDTSGLDEAAQTADALGLTLIPGVEVSVTWEGRVVHIVGLGLDSEHPELKSGLAKLREFRDWRAEEIARRLEKAGIPGALEGARRYASGPIIGRTHFARFLVEAGHAPDVRHVFKRYLVRGKPGHVAGEWADLNAAVGWIRNAGGMAVVAHPARYDLTATKLRRLLGAFVQAGGEGIEVVSGSHSRDDAFRMAEFSRRHGLLASAGSDYHGPENPWIELGRIPALPDGCRPIWESQRWQTQVMAS